MELVEDGLDGDGGVVTAELEERVVQRGRALVERLDEDVEARRVRGDEAGEVGDQHDRREVLHVGHLESAQQRAQAVADELERLRVDLLVVEQPQQEGLG